MPFDRGWDPRTSVLAGMPKHFLEAELFASQRAMLELQRGAKAYTASYSQADGNKSVTYTAASLPNLMQQIRMLQLQLGLLPHNRAPRRVLRPVYY